MSVKPKIIFEDDLLVVIDKPYGVVVNKADTTSNIETIQDWMEETNRENLQSLRDKENRSEIEEEFLSRGGVVHRLDKDTSGILVLAKTAPSFEKLKNQFKDRTTTKKYLALVHGRVEPIEGIIDAPIERSPFNRMHFGVFPGGREAQTKYRVIKNITRKEGEFSLVEVEPKTGRTHQIRVHMKYIGHPIVSDPIYGGRKQVREDQKWCPRLFLHAESLEIVHPLTGEILVLQSELPEDLNNVLSDKDKI